MIKDDRLLNDLYNALSLLDNADDSRMLLKDLCTYTELLNMAQRLRASAMLIEGATYAQIIEETGISSATLSRVNRCIQTGDGGYQDIYDKLNK